MNKQTTLWLLLLALVLAVAVWWQRGREEEDLGALEIPLFEGVQVARIKALRVDHLERNLQLRLERDARGAWYISDPILYPADPALVKVLLDVIHQSRALIVPKIERDAAALGFEPPRALFVVEENVDGALVEHELELGYLDLDGRRVNVRKDGRYLRILRTLDTTLSRSANDFRSPRALQIDAGAVVELNRTGTYQAKVEDLPVTLDLHAVRDGPEWRTLGPREGLLDPRDLSVLLIGSATLQVDRFIEGTAGSLADYGLDPPEFRIELRSADGTREALRFGRKRFGGNWNACREGDALVFGVAEEDVWRLVLPLEEMLDRHVVRMVKDEVQALRLECGADVTLVERADEGWTVSVLTPAGELRVPPVAAERARVEELLSRLEHAELVEFRLDERFPADASGRGVFLELGQRTIGGRLGERAQDPQGRELHLFQRLGDDFVSWVEPWLVELACTPLDELRALDLSDVVEVELAELELRHDARSLRYERSERGRWSRAGETTEASELMPVLDPLIFLRARRHLAAAAPTLERPIEVVLRKRDGAELSFRLGLIDGATAIEFGSGLSLARVADLHARLLALFDG